MFDKILNQEDLLFSNRTPDVAQDLICKLLDKKPDRRLGYEDFEDLKNHPFFKGINWKEMEYILPPDESVIQLMTTPMTLKKDCSHARLSVKNRFPIKNDSSDEENEKKSNLNFKSKNGNHKDVLQSKDDSEYKSLGAGNELKKDQSYKQPHKNTVSTSNTKDAEYEQIKYNLRRSTLKQSNSKLDLNLKHNKKDLIKVANQESLVLECIVLI